MGLLGLGRRGVMGLLDKQWGAGFGVGGCWVMGWGGSI